IARLRSRHLQDSQPRQRRRLHPESLRRARRPILRSPDSRPQRILLLPLRRQQFAAEPAGSPYARRVRARAPVRSPPAQTNQSLSATTCLAPSIFTMPTVSPIIHVTDHFFGRLKSLPHHGQNSIDFANATTIEQPFGRYAALPP